MFHALEIIGIHKRADILVDVIGRPDRSIWESDDGRSLPLRLKQITAINYLLVSHRLTKQIASFVV